MRRLSRGVVLALGLTLLGIVGLVLVISGSDDVRGHIAKTYRFVGREPVPGDDDQSLIYESDRPPTRTAADIADAVSPGERRVTPSGVFLRYSDDMVAVVPRTGGGGSRIYVDDEDSGYRRNYFYVGGFWGLYSGRAEGFRGGGPGSGK